MTQDQIDILMTRIDQRFDDAKERYNNLREDLRRIENNLPKIAQEKAEEVQAKTAFLTPQAKIAIATFALMVLGMLFGIYGKQTTLNTQVGGLMSDIKTHHVIENSIWLKDNKNPLTQEIRNFRKEIEKAKIERKSIWDAVKVLYNNDVKGKRFNFNQ